MKNVGKIRHLVEEYTGRKNINPELFLDLLNDVLLDFASRTAVIESGATISSVASTQEYELPLSAIHIKQVIYDDYDITRNKILYSQVKELEGQAQ